MTVFDSSALIAFLRDEQGAVVVEQSLADGGWVSAANWSEVAQKSSVGADRWPQAREVLLAFGLVVEPVTAVDAERAADLWERGSGLALADRLCLALGERLSTDILTCDKQWEGKPGVVLVR